MRVVLPWLLCAASARADTIEVGPDDDVFVFITDSDSGAHTWAYRFAR